MASSMERMENNYIDTLVERVSNGDNEAFVELCRYKYEDIYFLALKILNNHHDVEDITQEVVLKIYNNIGKLKKTQSFSAWVYSLVTNTCNDFLRKKKRRHEEIGYEEESELIEENSNDTIPHKNFEESEFEDYVAGLIGRLPSDRQRCFHLYYYDGLKYKEIAEVMGISKNTVGSNIKRAKEALKKEIEKNTDYEIYFKEDEEQEDE